MAEYHKPVPVPDEQSAAIWDAARLHLFVIERCRTCGWYSHPPEMVCPNCQGVEFAFEQVSGRGRIKSWTVVRHGFVDGFEDDIPYVNVIVELEEQVGLYFLATLSGGSDADISWDAQVEVTFDDVTPEVTLPKFRIVEARVNDGF